MGSSWGFLFSDERQKKREANTAKDYFISVYWINAELSELSTQLVLDPTELSIKVVIVSTLTNNSTASSERSKERKVFAQNIWISLTHMRVWEKSDIIERRKRSERNRMKAHSVKLWEWKPLDVWPEFDNNMEVWNILLNRVEEHGKLFFLSFNEASSWTRAEYVDVDDRQSY